MPWGLRWESRRNVVFDRAIQQGKEGIGRVPIPGGMYRMHRSGTWGCGVVAGPAALRGMVGRDGWPGLLDWE